MTVCAGWRFLRALSDLFPSFDDLDVALPHGGLCILSTCVPVICC